MGDEEARNTNGQKQGRNPLDTGEMFDLGLFNPNPSSSKTKDGPKYRVSFEVERDVWDLFMAAKTEGMILACKAMATVDGQFVEPKPKSEGGEIARLLKASGFFRKREVAEAIGKEEEYMAWCRREKCEICGAGDWDPGKGQWHNQFAHVSRINAGAGKGFKAPWLGMPLCSVCHGEQHQAGWAHYGWTLEEAEEVAIRYRERWAWQTFKELYSLDSMRDVTKEIIQEFAEQNHVEQFLPQGVSEHP